MTDMVFEWVTRQYGDLMPHEDLITNNMDFGTARLTDFGLSFSLDKSKSELDAFRVKSTDSAIEKLVKETIARLSFVDARQKPHQVEGTMKTRAIRRRRQRRSFTVESRCTNWNIAEGVVPTESFTGDWFASVLEHSTNSRHLDAFDNWIYELKQNLSGYEKEARQLVTLTDTGRVVQLMERAVQTTLDVLGIRDSTTATSWYRRLRRQRKKRMKYYNDLLASDKDFLLALGDEEQQLEILTLMKRNYDTYCSVLTVRELDVISKVYDAVVQHSNPVVVTTPEWFTMTETEWSVTHKSLVAGEEVCLRQAAIWSKLYHPNVRKILRRLPRWKTVCDSRGLRRDKICFVAHVSWLCAWTTVCT